MHKVRNDILLVGVILFISILSLILIYSCSKRENLKALIYCEDKLILEVPLTEEKEYSVEGKEGKVNIKTYVNAICIKESNCKDKICIHQGKINSSNQTITCLPNRIYIKIIGIKEDVDVII